jgi:hypothetical protein
VEIQLLKLTFTQRLEFIELPFLVELLPEFTRLLNYAMADQDIKAKEY